LGISSLFDLHTPILIGFLFREANLSHSEAVYENGRLARFPAIVEGINKEESFLMQRKIQNQLHDAKQIDIHN